MAPPSDCPGHDGFRNSARSNRCARLSKGDDQQQAGHDTCSSAQRIKNACGGIARRSPPALLRATGDEKSGNHEEDEHGFVAVVIQIVQKRRRQHRGQRGLCQWHTNADVVENHQNDRQATQRIDALVARRWSARQRCRQRRRVFRFNAAARIPGLAGRLRHRVNDAAPPRTTFRARRGIRCPPPILEKWIHRQARLLYHGVKRVDVLHRARTNPQFAGRTRR